MSTYDKIPELLIDKATYLEKNKPSWLPEHHTQYTHLFCLLLRIFIGLSILQGKISTQSIIILCIVILLFFGSKYISKTVYWKNYLKTLLTYSIILFLQYNNIENKNTISGLLIIVDALLGQQSRYISTNMSRSAPN